MQPGTTAPVVGEQQVPATESGAGKKAASDATAATEKVAPAHSSAATTAAAQTNHGVTAKKKAVAKPVAKGKKPAVKKSSPAKRGAVEEKAPGVPASTLKAGGESFGVPLWVHPGIHSGQSMMEAGRGSSIEVKYSPPQVVHS
jgi:hypothetical protein